jgi:hypothetical protein
LAPHRQDRQAPVVLGRDHVDPAGYPPLTLQVVAGAGEPAEATNCRWEAFVLSRFFEDEAAVTEGRMLKPRSDMARNLAAASRAGATFVAIRY